ncbi:MAG TPA: histidine kinase dimerization/phosphoacceptor domain -containing protein [Chitinophagaceae bacterium]|nr:histidine kinase dimerization/phosphoacceptor domain -containing protein [Chitinophagaceae bacterium]HRG91478.1 histidine kinase dimerization/phosphoacceptor domain -containing protein [Chitinophagaceae bacterium]
MKKALIGFLILLPALLHAQHSQRPFADWPDEKAADTLSAIGIKYMLRSKNDSAMYFLDLALDAAIRTGNTEKIAKLYVDKANVGLFGDKQKAIGFLRQATPLLPKVNDPKIKERYYLIMGKCFRHLSVNDSALYYYRLCEKHNLEFNPYGNWILYLEMSILFGESNAAAEEEKYLLKAYQITKPKGVRMDHGLLISELLSFYSSKNNPERFASIVQENLAFEQARKKDYSKDPVHSMVFIDWSKYTLEDKVGFMKKVKESLLSNHDIINGMQANSLISSFYEKEGLPASSIPYMEENTRIATKYNDLKNHFVYTNALYRLQKKAGLQSASITTADKLLILKDSLYKTQQLDVILEMENKYQSEKKEKELALLTSQHELSRLQLKSETEKREALQRENQLKEEKLNKELLLRMALERENILADTSLARELQLNEALEREGSLRESELKKEKLLTAALSRENELKQFTITEGKKNKQILLAGIGLLVLAGAIILWLFSRQVKKNRIIRQQADEMEVLNREIHHRVKNNLQVISSLLDIQSQTLKDAEAAEVIRESRQRVQSMAFIHQNLYQSNTVQEIEINNYINNLAGHLFESYNIRKDRIRFTTDIDKLNLHTDTVIPLGMILNELISNSLKYAFNDLEEGEIMVAMKQKENELLLQVKDNGKGLPAGFDISKLQSFGFKVIRAFAQKLKAKLHIDGSHGTNVELTISKFKTI